MPELNSIRQSNPEMKLAVSNIAWYPGEIDDFITLLSSLRCEGIELAANMIWDEPIDVSITKRKELRAKIEDAGLKVTGLQSLLYTHPEFVLFNGKHLRIRMIDYLSKTMEVCRDLGGEVVVFGSPRNRNKGNTAEQKAYSIAVEFFSVMGRIAQENGVCFCIEPLGRTETNFINTVKDAERLIKDVGKSGLGLHIDAKGLIDAKEYDAPYLIDSFSKAKHFHVNDSNLKPPGSTGFDHSLISSILQRSEYSQYISIEMRRIDDDVVGVIKKAVEYVNKTYFQ